MEISADTITVLANARQRLFLLVHLMQQASPDQADRDAKASLLACFDLAAAADDLSFQGGREQGAFTVDRDAWKGTHPKPYFLAPADAATLDRVLAVNVSGAFAYQLGRLGASLAEGRRVNEQSRAARGIAPTTVDGTSAGAGDNAPA